MSNTKNKNSVAVVYKTIKLKNNKTKKVICGYLSNRDEMNGLDIKLDLSGYTIVSL